MENQTQEKILSIISEINSASMSFAGGNGHWIIVFTANAIYFVKNSSSSWYQGNPGVVFGAVGGLVGGLVKNALSKNKDKVDVNDLPSILEHSKKYYRFAINQFNQIGVQNTWRNKSISLDGVESQKFEILVNGEQYDDFITNAKRFYNYNFA